MRDAPSSPPEADAGLPFDPRTLAVGLRARWKTVAGFAVAGAGLGVLAALVLGVRTYEAETVLLYQPLVGCPTSTCSATPPTLTSVADLVKVQPVLSKVRQTLDRAATLQELGASVSVTAKKGTDLVVLRARGESPEDAQALCVAVRDAFLADQVERLRGDKRVELRRQAEQARIDRGTLQAQVADLNRRAADLRSQATSERKQLGLDDADRARIQRQIMLENITEDQRRRLATVELGQAEAEYRRAQQLAEKEVISPAELDKVRAAYEKAKQLATDPPNVLELKAERQRLEAMAASGGYGLTPAEQLLLLVLNRNVEVELRRVEASERERALAAELKRLDAPAGDLGPSESGFAIISEPQRPPVPLSSTRRMLAVAVAVLLSLLGGGYVLGRELLDRSLRSGAEAALCLGTPTLAVLPLAAGQAARPGETYRLLAGRLRQAIRAHRWRRILVSSAVHGEGRSTTCAELARSLEELGEQVRVVTLRPGEPARGLLARLEGAQDGSDPALVIVDGPPILPYADVLLLAPAVDCAVVIVKAGSTHRDLVRRALARLQEAAIPQVGVVLNAVAPAFLRKVDAAEGAR